MKPMLRIIFILTGLLLACSGVWAANDEIGEVVFIEGNVQIIRNAKALGSGEVGFGTIIQNFDQLKVGKNGQVDIKMDERTGITGTISIKPGAVVTLDVTSMKSKQPGTIDLMAGAVAMKVKLADGGRLNVRSGTAAMGVRGTEFEVDLAIGGDVLLTTSEGRVECVVPGLRVPLYSAPGNIVEGNGESDWSSQDVSVDTLNEFRSKWTKGKIEAFKVNPGRATIQFAQMYRKSRAEFNNAYDELFQGAANDVINRWRGEDNEGKIGSLASRNSDKKKLIGTIKKLRQSSFMLERSYYRLLELEDMYRQGIAASGQIEQGLGVAEFFKDFARQKDDVSRKLTEVNRVYKLYTLRNDGVSPMDSSQGFVDEDAFMKPVEF